MPGVMTKEQVQSEVDLDHWKIEFKGKTYTLDVSTALAVLSFIAYLTGLTHGLYSVSVGGMKPTPWTLSALEVALQNSPLVSGRKWFGKRF